MPHRDRVVVRIRASLQRTFPPKWAPRAKHVTANGAVRRPAIPARANAAGRRLERAKVIGRPLSTFALWFVGVLLVSSLSSSPCAAHDLAMDQVVLEPDFPHGELRGQVTFDPHRTRSKDVKDPARIGQRVVSALREELRIEIDARVCRASYEIRELWQPAGPTVGDIVLLSCPLSRSAKTLRVWAGAGLKALIVSIDLTGSSRTASSRSVMIPGGTWTPEFRFESDSDWRPGGAEQFTPDGGLVSNDAPADDVTPALPPPVAEPARGGFIETSRLGQAKRYLALGFRHILPAGWDHVLFVVGLVLAAHRSWRSLLLQLSAFTAAHTATLALGALGWVVLPRGVVEPLIAFSIAAIAIENLVPRCTIRYRSWVVFAFGLLHGQGFASALAQTGLPQHALVVALLAFNTGVELGQITVVLLALVLLRAIFAAGMHERRVVVAASLAIAAVGVIVGTARLIFFGGL